MIKITFLDIEKGIRHSWALHLFTEVLKLLFRGEFGIIVPIPQKLTFENET